MSAPELLVDRIEWIVGLDDQPVLRNLLITQCYHDVSSEVARVLGPQSVNWCTFATWASKTAGDFIRNEEVPKIFRSMLVDSAAFKASSARAAASLKHVHPATSFDEDSLLQVAEEAVGDVSGQIVAGNLKVFSELAPIFAKFATLFDDGKVDEQAAHALLDGLKVGPSARGGQSLLREAVEHMLAAAQETDERKRAQRMLVANAQTGLHEQIRLQPYIAGSLNAPIEDTLGKLIDRHSEEVSSRTLLGRIHSAWDRLGARLVNDVTEVWDDVATKVMMTLDIPGQTLHLGGDLPPPQGKPLYPALLDPIEDADALELLEHYDALDPDDKGEVGADNWTDLSQRMRYIIALFRSRQCEPSMFQQPFTEPQHAAIVDGKVPDGPL